jgi:chromodomain-helicase-DNA-binding protein 4
MASATSNRISDSMDSEREMARTPERKAQREESTAPQSVLSHRFRESPQRQADPKKGREGEDSIVVMVPAPTRPWEYQGATTVDTVLEEFEGPEGDIWYQIEYEDGKKEDVSMICCLISLEVLQV